MSEENCKVKSEENLAHGWRTLARDRLVAVLQNPLADVDTLLRVIRQLQDLDVDEPRR